MIDLDPCPECHRHVSVAEPACPFCGIALDRRLAQPFARHRLSRAAVFVAGAALGACWTSKPATEPHDRADQQITPPADAAETATGHHFATPPGDAGVAAVPIDAPPIPRTNQQQNNFHSHGCYSPGNGQPPVCAPYGAPPARRRLV